MAFCQALAEKSVQAKRYRSFGFAQTPNEGVAGKQSPSLDSHYFPLNRAFLHKSPTVYEFDGGKSTDNLP